MTEMSATVAMESRENESLVPHLFSEGQNMLCPKQIMLARIEGTINLRHIV